jgi:hypothetical protein
MDQRDLAAMRLAIETLRKDPELGDQIGAMLRTQSEQEVGAFAAGLCQVRSLRLKPWECPPCDTGGGVNVALYYGSRPGEIELLRRMLAAGVSRFNPDPMQALAAVAA